MTLNLRVGNFRARARIKKQTLRLTSIFLLTKSILPYETCTSDEIKTRLRNLYLITKITISNMINLEIPTPQNMLHHSECGKYDSIEGRGADATITTKEIYISP